MTTPDWTTRFRLKDPHQCAELYGRGLLAQCLGLGSGVALAMLSRRWRAVLGMLGGGVVYLSARHFFCRQAFRLHARTSTPLEETGTLTVVVPVYNTGREVLKVLDEIYDVLHEQLGNNRRNILAVDDGSSLESETALWLAKSGVRVITLEHNRGKGAALRAGMAHSDGYAVILLDGDGAYDPHLAADMLTLLGKADVVIGRRAKGAAGGRDGLVRNVASRFFHMVTRVVLLDDYDDTQAGIKVLRGDVARNYARVGKIDRFAYDVELLATCETRGWIVGQADVSPRTQASSTVRFSAASQTLRDIFRIRILQRRGAYAAK